MIALALAVTLLAGTAEQDALNAARDLYASAAYEDALAVLSRLPEAGRPADEARAISQYRAFCLLALGRSAEAERAIETIISRDPTFRPLANDVSPRVRAAFTDVRRRILPTVIQQKYALAKAAFDRKEFDAAVIGFGQVLDVMNDPDAAAAASQPPLSDMRMLAGGFRDLATRAAAPPPLPVTIAPIVTATTPAAPAPPKIYAASDTDVVPPIPVRQELPGFPGQLVVGRQGSLEITINENGLVDLVVIRQSITPAYDNMALSAAKTWRYRPATVNGVPVKYRKVIQVTIQPQPKR